MTHESVVNVVNFIYILPPLTTSGQWGEDVVNLIIYYSLLYESRELFRDTCK